VIFGLSSGLWLAFCFLSDQRGALLFSVVTYLIAYHRYISRVSKITTLTTVSLALALVVVRTVLRIQSGAGAFQEDFANVLGNFVGQNLIEHAKMISIVKAVPEFIDFQYGFTYLNAILQLIPRALFPAKPFVNLDTTIGNQVFDCNMFGACAVPPGLLAESYLNFGVAGVALLPMAMGVLIGKIDSAFKNAERGCLYDLFYLASLLYLGMAILGSGISSSITSVITQGAAATALWFFCGRRRTARWGVRSQLCSN